MNEVTVHEYPITQSDVIELTDLDIDNRVKGFCDETMTLLFKCHPLFNPTLLPNGVLPINAGTDVILTSSLAFTDHPQVVSYIKVDVLSRLYHVIDNPVVSYDPITKSYQERYMYYIDKDSMTGVVIGNSKGVTGYHSVYGIFAPRGYDKIKCYNNFNELYLTERLVVEQELTEYLGVGDE